MITVTEEQATDPTLMSVEISGKPGREAVRIGGHLVPCSSAVFELTARSTPSLTIELPIAQGASISHDAVQVLLTEESRTVLVELGWTAPSDTTSSRIRQRQILAVPMDENDSGANTIRGYLVALLATVWDEGASFSGKRPFGNSGWKYDLIGALVKAGKVAGRLDEDGCLEESDDEAGWLLIKQAIEALGDAT